MASKTRETLEDLKLTTDEIKNLTKAFKDENFRKLFVEYAEELQDPENRKRYEEEIAQMEREKGMDVEFIHPEPGHVLKTCVNGDTKAFINVCQSDKIEKPKSSAQKAPNGKMGMHWQIPHSTSRPRDDVDKQKNKCKVFDVVFNPDTYRMTSNERFLKLVNDTALDAVRDQLGFSVDKNNVVQLQKMKFKGMPQATILRTKNPEGPKPQEEKDGDDILNSMPYPYDDKSSEDKAREMREKHKNDKDKAKKSPQTKFKNENYTEPQYAVVHRSDLDIQEYRNAPDAKTNTRPKEIEVKIMLPLLSSAAEAELDIFEQKLILKSEKPAKYKLDLKLPYPVDEEFGKAKFDKTKKCLIVTLPVIQIKTLNHHLVKEETETNQNCLDNKESNVPLVQEITKEDNQVKDNELPSLLDTPSNDDQQLHVAAQESPKPKIAYTFPYMSFNQDDSTVSFILNVKNIKIDHITKTFPDASSAIFTLVSIGSGGFPLHYQFVVIFQEDKRIVVEHTTIDISESNVVIVLLKSRNSRGLWNSFQAGVDTDNLEDYLFVTESNIQQELEALEADAAKVKQSGQQSSTEQDSFPQVHVTDMSEKKLKIKIRKADTEEEEEAVEEEEVTYTGEIQVVHETATPSHLHGILKQRSVSLSESSDDPSSCSPSSPRDDPFHKKSVSFNDHVDKATFKSGMSVSTMHKSLKSKKKRNKRREERKGGGRKRKNSGSEGSSGDENDARSSRSSSSFSEESDENGDKLADVSEEEDHHDGTATSKKELMVKTIRQTLSKKDECQDDDSDDEAGDDDNDVDKDDDAITLKTEDDNHERTKESFDKDVCENGKKEVKPSESVHNSNSDTSVNVEELKKEENVERQKNRNVPRIPGEQEVTISAKDVISKASLDVIEDVPVIKIAADKSADDSGVESTGEAADTSVSNDVESSLSWKNETQDITLQDHRTQCAFSFSNAVIFDLDVD